MSTIERDHDNAEQLVLITKGAPDVLIALCSHVQVGDTVVGLDASLRKKLLCDVDILSAAALRTLAVAYRLLAASDGSAANESLEHGLVFVGTVGMFDPPRAQAPAAIAVARRAGIRVIMITGDHPGTALRIAADLGIVASGDAALTGREIDALGDAEFAEAVQKTAVYARVSPEHKLRVVRALQAGGHIVAMTGDGVNDAPALKAADIGIAMGITGSDVAKQAAKMILVDDNFATIVTAVEEGRSIFDSIAKFLRYLLSSNMGEILTIFVGTIGAGVIGLPVAQGQVALPLLATQVLWINLVTDSGPALAMGLDPPAGDIMARRPRHASARMINRRMLTGVVQAGTAMAAATLLTIDMLLPGGLIEGNHDLATARTAGFTVLVLAQLFNCFNARSETLSAFSRPFVNRWLWAAVALSAMLQVAVVNIPFLNIAFGTVPLEPAQWLSCAAMASTVLWYSELRKVGERTWANASMKPRHG
jgi:Ca2+-transporting ATPase